MILDGRAIAERSPGLGAIDPRTYLLAFYPDAVIPPLGHVVLTAEPMVARVNWGQWIASCSCGAPTRPGDPGVPSPGCVVFFDAPLGFCVRCGNRPWGGGWRRIAVPDPETRAGIEAALVYRPEIPTRNWEPGEAVADLIAENRAHGVGGPGDDEPPPDVVLIPVQASWPTDEARAAMREADPRRRGRRRLRLPWR